jgi:EAL domain-containing protein (putative c-di-GMP-specific phosphodiesterase class I)/DNA-binding response OmpR family regulator
MPGGVIGDRLTAHSAPDADMPEPMRILVADDEPDLRELLQINLEALGHEVQLAVDGTEALALAMAHRPDLIVLDIMMPGLNGLEVLRRLREEPANADLPVVLLSARGTDSEVFEGWSSGANYYITKPFELDELLDFIEQVRAQSRHAPEQGGDLDIAFTVGGGNDDLPPRLALETPEDHHRLEMDLQGALVAGQFFLAYQPSFHLRNVTVTGVEALIRWRHPIWGTVQPADFIPVLERTGLMVQVGRWVLRDACRQAALWRGEGYQLAVTVNVSTGQFESAGLVADVEAALAASGLDPGSLVIDVPESALTGDVALFAGRLMALKELGLRVAIDDFGLGDLPASVLTQLPVDTLKIHRSFMSGVTGSSDSADPMRAVLEIGRSCGLETVAKGIEQQEQLMNLQREQCDGGQGFLFAPSMDAEAVGLLLNTWAVRQGQLAVEPDVTVIPAFGR